MDYFTSKETFNRQTNSIDFKSYIDRILAEWWIMAISFFICVGAVVLFLHYKTPMYKINAKVLVEDEKKGGGGGLNASEMFGDLGGLLSMKSNVDNEAEILKTRALMEKVVRTNNLNITYYKKESLKNIQLHSAPFLVEILKNNDSIETTKFYLSFIKSNLLELTYENKITNGQIEIRHIIGKQCEIPGVGIIKISKNSNDMPLGDYMVTVTSVDLAVAALQKELNVAVTNKLVTTIDISLNYPLPKKGEEILNKLIEEYANQNIYDKNQIADSTIAFIENRLAYVGRELGDVEGNIQTFKQGNKIADIVEQSKLLVTNSSDFIKQIAAIDAQINVIEALEESLKKEDKTVRVMPSSVLPQDLVFGRLVESYNFLLLERDRQAVASTDENPFIKNLEERILTLRNTILSNLSNAKKNFLINKAQLQKDMDKLEKGIRDVPSQERTYLDLARQQKIKQELYLYLMQKREEVAISKTSNISNSKVIDPPKSEFKPYSPNKPMIFLVGIVLALVLPFARLYAADILNDKVQTKEDIQKYTGIPVIGEISLNDTGHTLVISKDPRSPIAEQFRALRTNLHFYLSGQKSKIILLTSSMSGEGKSFSAANIGNVLAISGKKVLMMELDLRKPSLSANLEIKNELGFTNYIITPELEHSQIVFPSKIHENLFIISSGPLPPNPSETLLSERMEQLMHKLKDEYDYIILDAPPIGLVTDAQLLDKYAHITLYLVRQKYTLKSQLSIPEELIKSNKMQKIGIVINGVKKTGGYGGYGSYGQEPQKIKGLVGFINKIKKLGKS